MVESTGRFAQFEWDQAKTIFGDFRSRPTQIQRDQEKFRHEGGEQEGIPTGPPSPPPPVQVPPLRPNLDAYGFGQLSQFEDDT